MRYAAYGSNLHPLRLRERTPSAVLLGSEVLAGFALEFVKRGRDGSGKCTIVSDPASRVHVAVYEIDDREKPDLDRAEGLGAGYALEVLELAGFGRCHTYVGQARHLDRSLRPYTWYQSLVLVGCEALGFPGDYVERIRSVAAVRDPDPERHARHMEIVRRARGGRLV